MWDKDCMGVYDFPEIPDVSNFAACLSGQSVSDCIVDIDCIVRISSGTSNAEPA